MQRNALLAATLLASALFGAAAHAAPIGGPSALTVAGVTFSGFECTLTGAGNAAPGACAQIVVGANAQGDGISFSSGFTAMGEGLNFSDAVLTFRASAAPGAAGIAGVSLGFNGTFLGMAVASVTETVRDAATLRQLAFLEVACDPYECRRNDPVAGYMDLGAGYAELLIQKDINVSAFRGRAQISIVDQGFRTHVPEPASMALFGVGLLGLALGRRRRA